MNSPRILACAVAATALSLGGCGGGGGGGPTPIPPSTQFSVGGTATGIAGPGLSLLNNGADLLAIGGPGPFAFTTLLNDGAAYDVTVATAPPTLACSTSAGSGTIAKADVTDVAVNCAARSYSSVSADTGGGDSTSGRVVVGRDGTIYFVTWKNVASGGSGGLYSLAPGSSTAVLLHAFAGGTSDGANPAGLTLSPDGTTLYGATNGGGSNGGGTLYSYTIANGAYTTLHEFGAGTDGIKPLVPPEFASSNLLYGVTNAGGSAGYGVVYNYELSTGTYTVLYTFAGGTADGANPLGGPVLSNGVYYGALTGGGANNKGAIYKLVMSGGTATETILHDFGGTVGSQTDGIEPFNVILGPNGMLYGATNTGGANSDGIVFSMNTDGSNYTILHDFAGGTGDGANAWGGVVLGTDGKIYGETSGGGAYNGGTLWSLTPSGTLTLLHSFGGTGDGIDPTSCSMSLLPDGRIYGGSTEGGDNSRGTVWSFQ